MFLQSESELTVRDGGLSATTSRTGSSRRAAALVIEYVRVRAVRRVRGAGPPQVEPAAGGAQTPVEAVRLAQLYGGGARHLLVVRDDVEPGTLPDELPQHRAGAPLAACAPRPAAAG